MKRQSRPDVLQVEQLFDNGTHPTIQDTLFAGEYGPTTGPACPTSHPVCPGQMSIDEAPLTPFAAAELAMTRAMESDEVASAKNLESILGGNGEWTAERAFEVWQAEMSKLGFAEYATEETP